MCPLIKLTNQFFGVKILVWIVCNKKSWPSYSDPLLWVVSCKKPILFPLNCAEESEHLLTEVEAHIRMGCKHEWSPTRLSRGISYSLVSRFGLKLVPKPATSTNLVMLELNLLLAGFEVLKNPLPSGESCNITASLLASASSDVKKEMDSIIQC